MGPTTTSTRPRASGQLQPNGLIKEVWGTSAPIKPDPFLKSYPWAKGL